MLRLLVAILPGLRSALRSRRDLVIENLALRQQLATLSRRRRPDLRPAERVSWVLLRRLWSGWTALLAIVRPDTVVRWHRAGFRIYWNWLSRRGTRSGRPSLPRRYHQDRTHLGLGKDAPRGRPVERRPSSTSAVVGLPRVGGLHLRRRGPTVDLRKTPGCGVEGRGECLG